MNKYSQCVYVLRDTSPSIDPIMRKVASLHILFHDMTNLLYDEH